MHPDQVDAVTYSACCLSRRPKRPLPESRLSGNRSPNDFVPKACTKASVPDVRDLGAFYLRRLQELVPEPKLRILLQVTFPRVSKYTIFELSGCENYILNGNQDQILGT